LQKLAKILKQLAKKILVDVRFSQYWQIFVQELPLHQKFLNACCSVRLIDHHLCLEIISEQIDESTDKSIRNLISKHIDKLDAS
jgi:hypothetical protein